MFALNNSLTDGRLRSQVAAGETRQPGGSNMMELQWDEELARVAQAHADQCKFRSALQLLHCYYSERAVVSSF